MTDYQQIQLLCSYCKLGLKKTQSARWLHTSAFTKERPTWGTGTGFKIAGQLQWAKLEEPRKSLDI